MASDTKRMITGTILFIFHFHLVIVSDGGFWVESGGSLQFGVAREATNLYHECSSDGGQISELLVATGYGRNVYR